MVHFSLMTCGARALLTAKSEKHKYTCGSNFDSLSTVTSPDLQKPKKAVVHAAHSMILLNVGCSSHTGLSLCRIDGVMGTQGQGAFPVLAVRTLMPLMTGTFDQLRDVNSLLLFVSDRHLINKFR